MKSLKFQKRFYREWVKQKDLHLEHISAKETDLEILTNKRLDKDYVAERIRTYRYDIENYINRDRRFLTSLKPVPVELTAPAIIHEMSRDAKQANVGPMATVAGAIAEFLGRDLLKKGYRDVIVENGGDLFIKTTKPRLIGLYTGRSKVWNKLRLRVRPKDTPLGICTSSGTIGHSLSFGCADAVVILSKSASLADAVATATCNRINSKEDMQRALDFARSVPGVQGVAIFIRNQMISWGGIEFTG
ncbi:MAG: UPF0280 family protein [Candidatus Omnitrophica bacterium]|nr:UPF0280 family protein [Candidatus Omnitrophota bacterium]